MPVWKEPVAKPANTVSVSVLHPNSIAGIILQTDRASVQPLRAEATARPRLSIAILLAGDLAGLTLAAAGSIVLWKRLGAPFDPALYLHLWPVLLLFPFAYAASGLYPGFGRNPVDQLRKLSATTSLVYPALAVTIFLLKDAATYSRGVFVVAWVQTLILVPSLRALVRAACSRKSWWGYPVIVVGARRVAAAHRGTLESQPGIGLQAGGDPRGPRSGGLAGSQPPRPARDPSDG